MYACHVGFEPSTHNQRYGSVSNILCSNPHSIVVGVVGSNSHTAYAQRAHGTVERYAGFQRVTARASRLTGVGPVIIFERSKGQSVG